ncbi:hypothetical protein INT45_011547 [Circinella minor]|uniref:Endonuclease/exonuclease/phosphatase domain-containing protein n=1 Tax=Circinella minor TaxID=1195481 RepID=A0A8H7S7W0_9FUNG|nr:hypothetical protein INT45_011547 [Circinella minor]
MFNASGIERTPVEIIQQCENNNINIILITETFLLEGQRLNTNWQQIHNHAIIHGNAHRGIYTLHGVYLPPSSMSTNEYISTINNLSIDDHTIIFGDFNTRLGTRTGDLRRNGRAAPFTDWLHNNNLINWNERLSRGQYTYRKKEYKSIIDFFISRDTAVVNPAIKIFDTLSLNSDHHLCRLRFNPSTALLKKSPANAERLHWKLQRLQEPDVKDLYINIFSNEVDHIIQEINNAKQKQHPDPQCMDHISNLLEDSIYKALDQSVTRTQIRPKSWKWFWTPELQELADNRDRLYRRWHFTTLHTLERAAYWEEYDTARILLRKTIKATRSQQWYEFCQQMATASVSESNAIIKRIRKRKKQANTFSYPEGPAHAANEMISHLSSVFGGEQRYIRPPPTSIRTPPDHNYLSPEVLLDIIKNLSP